MITNPAHFRNRMGVLANLINKSVDQVAEDVMRLGVEQAIRLTAPFNRGQSFTEALGKQKKLGEAAVARDIRRVFRDTESDSDTDFIKGVFRVMKADGLKAAADMLKRAKVSNPIAISAPTADEHQEQRRHGRVMKKPTKRYLVAGGIDDYIRQRIKAVGKLKAGWMPAAVRLKAARKATPAWVTRHTSPGDYSVRTTGTVKRWQARNLVPHIADSPEHRSIEAMVAASMEVNLERRIVKIRQAIRKGWRPNAAA